VGALHKAMRGKGGESHSTAQGRGGPDAGAAPSKAVAVGGRPSVGGGHRRVDEGDGAVDWTKNVIIWLHKVQKCV